MTYYIEWLFLISLFSQCCFLFWLGRRGDQKADSVPDSLSELSFYYRYFYVNAEDPRGWVSRSPGGRPFILNFRARSHVHQFLILLAATLLSSLLLLGSAFFL